MTTSDAFRRFYARYIVANSGVPDVQERLTAAFAAVAREDYVGDGPWSIPTAAGYIKTPSADPAFLYQDILVALQGEGLINPKTGEGPVHNGQPTLHALCLAHANPRDGDSVVHVGAGTGYYTAVLAMLVGPSGTVVAYEINRDLAARATRNLSHLSNVIVRAATGTEGPMPYANVMYVSAGATAPLDVWLNALTQRGRLIFPLTPAEGLGGMLLVTRHERADTFSAKFISPAMFIPCIGARDDRTAQQLTKIFRLGVLDHVNSLWRNTPADDTCWFAGDGWWLSTRHVEEAPEV
jgi:protein-L-isoaspartate(D-aspartate) O-methyltransferase